MAITKSEGRFIFMAIIYLHLFSITSPAFALSLAPPEFNTIWSLAFKNKTTDNSADYNYIVYIHKDNLIPTRDGAIATFLIDFNSAQKSKATFLIDFNSVQKSKVLNEEIEFRSAEVEIQVNCSFESQRTFDKRLFSEKLGKGVWQNEMEVINPKWNYHFANDVIPNRELISYICEKKYTATPEKNKNSRGKTKRSIK